jgi:S-formylglutathione hydrolase FrmB
MQYRVVLPASIKTGEKLPAVYLLHGGGGDFRSWTNDSDVARFAENGMILVMPQGDSSYYVNSAEHAHNRYEDYIASDLIVDSQGKFPIAKSRGDTILLCLMRRAGRLVTSQSETRQTLGGPPFSF